MVSEVFYEKFISAISHAFDEVKTRVVVDYVKIHFFASP
jgi:hypothetical protein